MTDREKELMDELEAVKGEAAGLKQENEAMTAELQSRNTAIVRLEQALAGKDSEMAALKQSVSEADGKLAGLSTELAQAVASYKDLVIKANPGVLADLVTGKTVAEVDESLKNALALIERVKQEMEAEVSRTRVPAGAPQRAPLDLSALSPREKIQYAIGGNK